MKFLFTILCLLLVSESFACNVCHSKNPKMVEMHKALEYKGCFDCHGIRKGKTKEELQFQQKNDIKCQKCHLYR